jgi:hypothetical protein
MRSKAILWSFFYKVVDQRFFINNNLYSLFMSNHSKIINPYGKAWHLHYLQWRNICTFVRYEKEQISHKMVTVALPSPNVEVTGPKLTAVFDSRGGATEGSEHGVRK